MTEPRIFLSSGAVFDYRAAELTPWTIDDIARGLACTSRFRGQTCTYYSVAQHSVLMSREAPHEIALAALFHDAAEAFIGDIPTPLKDMFPQLRALEEEILAAILQRLGLPPAVPSAVKALDRRMLAAEVRDLLPSDRHDWAALRGVEPLGLQVEPVGPKRAQWEFHKRALELLGGQRYRALNRDSRQRLAAAGARRG